MWTPPRQDGKNLPLVGIQTNDQGYGYTNCVKKLKPFCFFINFIYKINVDKMPYNVPSIHFVRTCITRLIVCG